MIIQSVMIFVLGMLIAVLAAIALAPLLWARASNVTRQQLVSTLPLNEFEIRASRDHLRAEHAIKAHRLESKLEESEQAKARQLIEINRRELQILELNNQLSELKQELSEKQSQNVILMQNLDKRIPHLEDRSNRLMTVLIEREREIQSLRRHGIYNGSAAHEDTDLTEFYQAHDDIERMRYELEQEIDSEDAPRRTLIENAESLHDENRDLLSRVAKLQARLLELERQEVNETALLRAEMQNIAITLMEEHADIYRSQFHNIQSLAEHGVDPANQLPFEFEFDEKKPVFIEKAEIAAAEKAKNSDPTAGNEEEVYRKETSLTERLEILLKQK